MMKHVLLFIFLVTLVTSAEVKDEKDCKCWENFQPEKLEGGDTYYCRGEKNHRIFQCNEEKPPICQCEKDGKSVELDLGETDCLSVDLKDGRWCKNKEEFLEYFRKHPEHAIVD